MKDWNKYTILNRTGLFKVVGEFDSYDAAKIYLLTHDNTSWYIMRGSKEYHI